MIHAHMSLKKKKTLDDDGDVKLKVLVMCMNCLGLATLQDYFVFVCSLLCTGKKKSPVNVFYTILKWKGWYLWWMWLFIKLI